MNTNFKALSGAVASFAPTLASMLGGPLAGQAVSALEQSFGLAPDSGAEAVTKAIQAQAVTPEQILAAKEQDDAFRLKWKQMDLDVATLNASTDAAFNKDVIDDVADARKANAGNADVYSIGKIILFSFAGYMVLVSVGCAFLIANGKPIDSAILTAVAGLIGAITGYFASNAQTVVNFLYGGSLGGRKNADALQSSVAQLGTALGKAAQ